MLLQFTFKNFKSFRDEATLDLTAAELPEENDDERYVSIGDEKVLRAAAIYGANGGGKSNVVKAFQSMRWYVCEAHGLEYNGKRSWDDRFPRPFLFDSETQNLKTSFEVYFLAPSEPEQVYNYGFTVGFDGVGEEWLNLKSVGGVNNFDRVFYRNTQTEEFYGLEIPMRENILHATKKEVLLASIGAMLNVEQLKIVADFFGSAETLSFGLPEENLYLSRTLPRFDRQDKLEDFLNGIAPFLQKFDSSIVDVKHETKEDAEGKTFIKLLTAHKMSGSDVLTCIPMTEESDGTQKMLALYPYFRKAFDTGAPLFIDELNSRLHPLLQRSVLLSFLDPRQNPNGAQLIFTTHEPWLLDCDLLHRDEVWFAEKDDSGASSLYSLAEFRHDDKKNNYLENYLYGEYGAIPKLKAFRSVESQEASDENE